MTDYVNAFQNPSNVYHSEALRLVETMPDRAKFIDGVMRWNSNGCVPPSDVCELARHVGMPVDLVLSGEARERELGAFLSEYRKRDRHTRAEEVIEARAAHGPGVELVNVITGRKFTT